MSIVIDTVLLYGMQSCKAVRVRLRNALNSHVVAPNWHDVMQVFAHATAGCLTIRHFIDLSNVVLPGSLRTKECSVPHNKRR